MLQLQARVCQRSQVHQHEVTSLTHLRTMQLHSNAYLATLGRCTGEDTLLISASSSPSGSICKGRRMRLKVNAAVCAHSYCMYAYVPLAIGQFEYRYDWISVKQSNLWLTVKTEPKRRAFAIADLPFRDALQMTCDHFSALKSSYASILAIRPPIVNPSCMFYYVADPSKTMIQGRTYFISHTLHTHILICTAMTLLLLFLDSCSTAHWSIQPSRR